MSTDTRFVAGLSENTRQAMIELLNERLADALDLMLALKQAHWNLKGPGFIGVHQFLDEVVDRVRESADTMAERAQILGGQARGTTQEIGRTSRMDAYPADIIAVEDHVHALTERFRAIGERVREAIEAADEAGDEDTADLFTEVSRQLDKDAWMIGANARAAAA